MTEANRDSRNIVLTGFMGTGKTTVGRLLADELGFEFVDTDDVIESRHGPLPAIFSDLGEQAFRDLERALAAELADRGNLVISTGGGMMLDPQNVANLSRNGRVFCLVATPDQILERVTEREDRPLLVVSDPRERIIELLAEREPGYRRFPQLTTDDLSPEAVVNDLVTLTRSDPRRFAIDGPAGGYHYAVGAGLLPFVRQLAQIDGQLIVVTSEEVAARYLNSLSDIDHAVVLSSGGRHKNLEAVQRVYDSLIDLGAEQTTTVVSLGDSIIGDVAAFAAATLLRGLDLVHCPTDLIAMIDTSVGGKVGLDVPQGRNLIGLHKDPTAVVADVATLQTLSQREFAAGMAEVLKHALIAGSHLLGQLEAGQWEDQGHALPGALGSLQALVAQAVQVKIAIVQEDPFDTEDRRAVLNLGHTFAHAFEHVGEDNLIHGEAVGLGLIAAARLSEKVGIASDGLADRVEQLVSHVGLATSPPCELPVDRVLDAMWRDEKRRAGKLRFILLTDIGQPVISDDVPPEALADVLGNLQPAADR